MYYLGLITIAMLLGSVVFANPVRGAELLLGSLDDAQKSEFFTFFRLEQTGSGVEKDQRTSVTFKPSGETFKKLVTVTVWLDDNKKVTAVELALARTFVDHKTNGYFARDIAKSMLKTWLPAADLEKLKDLVNEIEYDLSGGGRIIINANVERPKLPETQTDGYKTYLGKSESFEQDLEKSKLTMQSNKTEKEEDGLLTIRVEAKR